MAEIYIDADGETIRGQIEAVHNQFGELRIAIEGSDAFSLYLTVQEAGELVSSVAAFLKDQRAHIDAALSEAPTCP